MAFAMRSSLASKAAVARPTRSVVAKAGNWNPGSERPAWLPDTLAANHGFDPLGLAKEPASLARFQESELIHCRWAMLGVAGVLGVEVLGFGSWTDAQTWPVSAGKPTWFGAELPWDINFVVAVEFLGFAISEGLRAEEKDQAKKCYPGGAFDPLGLSKDPKSFERYKENEVKNGRLAMLAFMGFVGQYYATGKSPLTALGDHLASPFTANFATNGVSIPGL